MRGAPILVLAAAAAVAVMAASALTQVGADRALEAQIAGDASAVLALSGFDGATIAIGSQYVRPQRGPVLRGRELPQE